VESYLNGTFLGDMADEFGDDLSADNATSALSPAGGERAPIEYITLPGGIMMEKKAFYIVVGILAAIAIYLYTKKKKASSE
jgi:hypothetical protein